MPRWVTEGMQQYQQRMPADYQLILHEIPAIKRDKHTDITRALHQEGEAILAKCQPHCPIIALDRLGKPINSTQLAKHLRAWHDDAQDINIIIGGPEGVSDAILESARHNWSLSQLTLPHPLVRVFISEQMYRAVSIIQGHPYHR